MLVASAISSDMCLPGNVISSNLLAPSVSSPHSCRCWTHEHCGVSHRFKASSSLNRSPLAKRARLWLCRQSDGSRRFGLATASHVIFKVCCSMLSKCPRCREAWRQKSLGYIGYITGLHAPKCRMQEPEICLAGPFFGFPRPRGSCAERRARFA